MKTIVNKTLRPLRVGLPGGKVLHLGPKKSGQVADGAVEHAALRKLIDAGDIEVQGVGEGAGADGGASLGEAGRESTHGHGKSNAVRRRSEEHTSELQSLRHLVCRLLLEKK